MTIKNVLHKRVKYGNMREKDTVQHRSCLCRFGVVVCLDYNMNSVVSVSVVGLELIEKAKIETYLKSYRQ